VLQTTLTMLMSMLAVMPDMVDNLKMVIQFVLQLIKANDLCWTFVM